MTGTAFPLGIYVGNPTGSNSALEAQFEAQFTAFSNTLGAQPSFIDAYIDETKSIDQWVSNASWQAWSNAQSPDAQNLTPVIGLPFTSTSAGSESADSFYRDFAAGKFDSVIQGVVKAWADQGFKTQYWRPGWEMNLTNMPSYAGSDAATQADWVKAFQHVSDVMHQAGQTYGVDVKVVWNPGITNYATAEATTSLYPGDQYVDVVGADVYADLHPYGDTTKLYDWDKSGQVLNASKPVYSSFAQWAADPVNLAHYYTDPAGTQWSLDGSGGHSLSLQNLIDFAKAHGKPIGIAETGAGSTNDGAGVSDNPTFVKWLSDTLTNAGVPISFVNIWDNNGGGNMQFANASDNKPLEAAAWAKYFGAQSAVQAQAQAQAPTPTVSASVGTGTDTLTLQLSEDAFRGDAQATVSVDGTQVGGVQTITASHAAGAQQTLTLHGSWGAGQHTVSVKFLNDLYVAGVGDRNLYVNGASYDGNTMAGAALTLSGSGAKSLLVSTPVQAVVPVSSGADTIDLKMSEDAFQGDAQFTVSVDGVQVGGTLTAQASHALGKDQDFQIQGNWGAGQHAVTVNFLNDAWGGSASADRNLYVDGVTYDGSAVAGGKFELARTSGQTVQAGLPDTLALQVSEDAYAGNAQFTVSVDGVQVGGTYTATASHAAGATQEIDVGGAWGAGTHTVAVNFLNDAWGGSLVTDRNLYVNGISYDGAVQNGATAALTADGAKTFQTISSTTYTEGAAGGAVTTLGNDTVLAGSGTVSIKELGPSLTVTGGAGQMSFVGGAGAATITAGTGSLSIVGGAGNLAVTLGHGNAVVTAGLGSEIFNLVSGQEGGTLMITGFASGRDVLHLSGYAGNAVRSEQVVGGSTNILLADNTRITLAGFSADALHPVFG